MITIRDVIRDREPYSVRENVTVLEAAEYMAGRKVGGVCVLDDVGHLIGVLTERDLLNSMSYRALTRRTCPSATP